MPFCGQLARLVKLCRPVRYRMLSHPVVPAGGIFGQNAAENGGRGLGTRVPLFGANYIICARGRSPFGGATVTGLHTRVDQL